MHLDSRKRKILFAIVDQFITTGEPVSSKTVAALLPMSISSATIRNDMAVLAKNGYLEQLHTSSGRVPSISAYKIYIQELMRPRDLPQEQKDMIDNLLEYQNLTVDDILENGLEVLTKVTGLTSVSFISVSIYSVITRVEVISAGYRLYVILLVTSCGTINNKVCRLTFDLLDDHVEYFNNFINLKLRGLPLSTIDKDFIDQLTLALGSYIFSLTPFLQIIESMIRDIDINRLILKGESNLLSNNSFEIKEVVDFLSEKKDNMLNLLCSSFEGIQVVFGKETESFSINNSSLIMSKCLLNDFNYGSIAVIAPIRLEYSKIIPFIEHFSYKISKLLSDIIENNLGGD